MKLVSQAMIDAIESPERVVFHDLQVDWDNDGYDGELSIDDVSRKTVMVRKTHALTSDLPPAVRMTPGVAVAELNMQLGSGNLVQAEIPVSYKSVSTGSSGSTTTTTASVDRPAGTQPGDVVLLAFMTSAFASNLGINGYTNVPWSVLALRGDGLDAVIIGYLLTRRVAINEPEKYFFDLGAATVWSAAAIRIGDPYIMGIHKYVSKGRDDGNAASPIVTGVPLSTTLPSTIISIFTADTGPIVSGSWTTDPTNADTERADFTTTAASGGHNISTAVMTRDDVPAGVFTSRATFSHTVNATLVFTIALVKRPSGDERQHAAWTFSELNPLSPYAGRIRSGRKTRWRVGFAGVNGVEYVNMFTGLTLEGGGSSRNRIATISALDNRETLRNSAMDRRIGRWTAETEDNSLKPGLEATFIVSFLFVNAFYLSQSGTILPRTNLIGYFPSPPPHTSTVFWMVAHGSFFAHDYSEVINAYTQEATGSRRRIVFTRGPFVGGTEPAPLSPGRVRGRWVSFVNRNTFVTSTSQSAGRIQLWAKRMTATASVTFGCEVNVTTTSYIEITTGGILRLLLTTQAGVSRTVTGPAVPSDMLWHYYAVHWDSLTGNVTFRVDGTATTTTFATWSNSVLTGAGNDILLTAANGMQVSELQVMAGVSSSGVATSYIIDIDDPWSYDTFVPTAFVDKSQLILDAIPVVDVAVDIWQVVSDIAQAEFAAAYFDDNGYPHYRTAYQDSTTTGQTVQKQLTARSHLADLTYQSSIKQVANKVSVGYEPVVLHASEEFWRSSGSVRVPGGGTYNVTLRFPGVIVSINDVQVAVANTLPDGSGTVVTTLFDWSWTSTNESEYSISIAIRNFNPFDIYLVDSSGEGSAYVIASWMSPVDVDVEPVSFLDSASIRTYMEQPMRIPSSPWRQREDVANGQAVQLVTTLARPHPQLSEVPIVGDPRLEFGDMCTVVDVNGLGVQGNYRISGITSVRDVDSGFSQIMTLRDAPAILIWNVNLWDDGFIWGP